VFSAFAQYDHEYADLTEKEVKYQDWTYPDVFTDEEVNLREFTKDKKLVMVFYFAPWCHSSNFQMPVTQKLYEKYKDQGLGIIGVSLYAEIYKTREKLKSKEITFPVVVESTSKFREKTLHYKYRTKTGDNRKWGTPYNVFLIPAKLKEKGDTLTKKTMVVNGEIREEEAEKYIREQLGLPAEKSKTTAKKEADKKEEH
jgi:peroxiredoxin